MTKDARPTKQEFLALLQQNSSPTPASSKRCYETMQALLMNESPRYQQAFHERLVSQLKVER